MSAVKVAIISLLLTACAELSTPADLDEPQLVALVADPPGLAAGEQGVLRVLVAGPDGLITPASTAWTLAEGHGATLSQGADGWTIRAPESGGPTQVRVDVDVRLDDGTSLLGHRTVLIGAPRTQAQPRITGVLVDGEPVSPESAMQLAAAGEHELRLEVTPAPGDGAIFSWFATVGELARYRHSPASIATPDPGTGVLVVVYRDGRGGVAFRSMEVEVR